MGLHFIGAPCTVCSRAMLITQLLDVLVVLECNVFVFLILLLNIIFTYANEFMFLSLLICLLEDISLHIGCLNCVFIICISIRLSVCVNALSEIMFTKFMWNGTMFVDLD